VIALVALSFAGWHAWRRKHLERLANTPRAKPEALQTWEGEGGGLPDGGPGQVVTPAAPRGDGSGAVRDVSST
jgi:hypothetical protein